MDCQGPICPLHTPIFQWRFWDTGCHSTLPEKRLGTGSPIVLWFPLTKSAWSKGSLSRMPGASRGDTASFSKRRYLLASSASWGSSLIEVENRFLPTKSSTFLPGHRWPCLFPSRQWLRSLLSNKGWQDPGHPPVLL